MESDTPRTDAENCIRDMGFEKWVSIDFARELERELAAANAALAEARRMISEINDENERLSAELAAEGATTASLLRIIALIREAGGFTREDLAALPDAVKAMRQQRDDAHSLIRTWRFNLVEVVDDGEIMYAMTSDGRCSMNDEHKRAFLAATAKEGGGA